MQFVGIFDKRWASSIDFGGFLEGAVQADWASSSALSGHLRRIAADFRRFANCQ
jgi:hypothetical protein